MKNFIIDYFRLLKQNYLNEMLVVPASLITVIIDAVKSGRFISLDLVAISLLHEYRLNIFLRNLNETFSCFWLVTVVYWRNDYVYERTVTWLKAKGYHRFLSFSKKLRSPAWRRKNTLPRTRHR